MTLDRRLVSTVGSAVLALGLSGCWPAPGQGPNRDAFNPFESTLTAANVASLTEAWSAPLDGPNFQPVTNPGGEIVVGHGGVYVNDSKGVYRFDVADGTRAWKRTVPAFPFEHFPEIAQPIVVGDRLLVGYGSVGDAGGVAPDWRSWWLDPATGATLADGPSGGAPMAVRGSQAALDFAICIQPQICAGRYTVVDLDTGEALSTAGTGPHLGNYQPSTLGRERLYRSGIDLQATSSRVQAFPLVAPGEAAPLWSQAIEPETGATAPVLSADESTLFVGTGFGGPGHTLYALDTATGSIEWTADVGAGVAAAPALADGLLYVPTTDGDLVVLDADGCGAATCAPLWSAAATGSSMAQQPAVAGGVVYTGSVDGSVHAFAAQGCGVATCAPLWSASTGAPIVGGPVVSGGRLYVVSATDFASGRVVAYGL